MRSYFSIAFLLLGPLAVIGNEPYLRVGVSVLPLKSIVSEVAGDGVEVESLQQEGDSCSVFEPRPSSVQYLARADIFFRTGLGFETVIIEKAEDRFTQLKVVDLRQAVKGVSMQEHSHSHGEHDHTCYTCEPAADTAMDPHIWMDPLRVGQIAEWAAGQLSIVAPAQADGFARRAAAVQARAAALDEELEALLKPYAGRAFFIYHPALSYFADRYGLEQLAVSSSGHAPTARELHQWIQTARKQGVRVIFVQPQESRKHAEIIARAVGASLVEIDPMAEDWEANLLRVGQALAKTFAQD